MYKEIISLSEAIGRVLSKDVICVKNLPAFNNSAMDGFAIKFSDAGKILSINKVIFAGDDVDMLSLPESDGFTDEAVVADTEGTAFGDESFVEEGESTPEADGFTAGSGDFTENAGESIEADADDFASEDFQ